MDDGPVFVSALARTTGSAHRRRGERGEDAGRVLHMPGGLLACLADGAGSAARGGAGAAFAVRRLTEALRGAMSRPLRGTISEPLRGAMSRPLHGAISEPLHGASALPGEDALAAHVGETAARLCERARENGLEPRDVATTLIAIVASGDAVQIAHVGDGAVVLRGDDGWRLASAPARGDVAGATHFLTDAAPVVRHTRIEGRVDAIAAFTDGLERLVLQMPTPDAPEPAAPPAFFARVIAPLDAAAEEGAAGRHGALSAALGRYIASEPVTARTDDDVTLLLAARA